MVSPKTDRKSSNGKFPEATRTPKPHVPTADAFVGVIFEPMDSVARREDRGPASSRNDLGTAT